MRWVADYVNLFTGLFFFFFNFFDLGKVDSTFLFLVCLYVIIILIFHNGRLNALGQGLGATKFFLAKKSGQIYLTNYTHNYQLSLHRLLTLLRGSRRKPDSPNSFPSLTFPPSPQNWVAGHPVLASEPQDITFFSNSGNCNISYCP